MKRPFAIPKSILSWLLIAVVVVGMMGLLCWALNGLAAERISAEPLSKTTVLEIAPGIRAQISHPQQLRYGPENVLGEELVLWIGGDVLTETVDYRVSVEHAGNVLVRDLDRQVLTAPVDLSTLPGRAGQMHFYVRAMPEVGGWPAAITLSFSVTSPSLAQTSRVALHLPVESEQAARERLFWMGVMGYLSAPETLIGGVVVAGIAVLTFFADRVQQKFRDELEKSRDEREKYRDERASWQDLIKLLDDLIYEERFVKARIRANALQEQSKKQNWDPVTRSKLDKSISGLLERTPTPALMAKGFETYLHEDDKALDKFVSAIAVICIRDQQDKYQRLHQALDNHNTLANESWRDVYQDAYNFHAATSDAICASKEILLRIMSRHFVCLLLKEGLSQNIAEDYSKRLIQDPGNLKSDEKGEKKEIEEAAISKSLEGIRTTIQGIGRRDPNPFLSDIVYGINLGLGKRIDLTWSQYDYPPLYEQSDLYDDAEILLWLKRKGFGAHPFPRSPAVDRLLFEDIGCDVFTAFYTPIINDPKTSVICWTKHDDDRLALALKLQWYLEAKRDRGAAIDAFAVRVKLFAGQLTYDKTAMQQVLEHVITCTSDTWVRLMLHNSNLFERLDRKDKSCLIQMLEWRFSGKRFKEFREQARRYGHSKINPNENSEWEDRIKEAASLSRMDLEPVMALKWLSVRPKHLERTCIIIEAEPQASEFNGQNDDMLLSCLNVILGYSSFFAQSQVNTIIVASRNAWGKTGRGGDVTPVEIIWTKSEMDKFMTARLHAASKDNPDSKRKVNQFAQLMSDSPIGEYQFKALLEKSEGSFGRLMQLCRQLVEAHVKDKDGWNSDIATETFNKTFGNVDPELAQNDLDEGKVK